MNSAELVVVDEQEQRFGLRAPDDLEIFITPQEPSPRPTTADSALVASLLYWMSRPFDTVRVRAAVSSALLVNLAELQLCWAKWRPERYSPVEFVPDAVVDDAPEGHGAIAAFSGGVDAAFTLLSHSGPDAHPMLRLRDVVMVHGFDIGLDEPDVFDRALARSRAMTGFFDVPVRVVRTNIKARLPVSWEDNFGLAVAAVLLTFQRERAVGLVGSSNAYDEILLRRGSTPVQDWMASTGRMAIRHDGAGYSRAEKAARIAAVPVLADNLRVCWSGPRHDRNCGDCEKCVRSMLNFAVAAQRVPASFPPLTLRRIAAVRLRAPHLIHQYAAILAAADAQGIDQPWVAATRRMVRRERIRLELRREVRSRLARTVVGDWYRGLRSTVEPGIPRARHLARMPWMS